MRYKVQYSLKAAKQLDDLPQKVKATVIAKVEKLAEDPWQAQQVKMLQGEDAYRLRVGDYRVVYRIEQEKIVIWVIRIKHRKEAYR